MTPQEHESFEEKRQRFIDEHNQDLNPRRRTPWPQNDPPRDDPDDKSSDRRRDDH